MLSHGLWARRFGSDPNIIGKTILLSGDPHEVIGIISPYFDLAEVGQPPELWVPFQLDPNTVDQGHFFTSAARLKSGVSLEQGQARLKLSAAEFTAKFPNGLGDGGGFSLERMQTVFVRGARPTLLILSAAVAFVLLIACANVANLLLVRATARKREIALRAAIGAGRGRIVRQMLTESVLLSLMGGVIGLVLGVLGIRALLSINTAGMPRLGQDGVLVGLDWRVLLFTAAISIGTGILFGLFPALQSSRTDLTTTLKDSTGRSGATLRHNKARSTLVVVEVALALLLLVGSALLIRTLVNLRNVQPGYDPTEHVDDAHVADGGEVHADRRGRAADSHGSRTSAERSRCPCCSGDVLRAARRRIRIAVPNHRPSAREGTVSWRRRLADDLARATSTCSRSRSSAVASSPSATMPGAGSGDHQRGVGEAVLQGQGSRRRAPDDRRRRDEGAEAGARARRSSAWQRRSRRRAQQRAGTAHVRAQCAGARCAQRAERPHHACRLGRAHAG